MKEQVENGVGGLGGTIWVGDRKAFISTVKERICTTVFLAWSVSCYLGVVRIRVATLDHPHIRFANNGPARKEAKPQQRGKGSVHLKKHRGKHNDDGVFHSKMIRVCLAWAEHRLQREDT